MTLSAPLRFLRIKSIAITGEQPLFTKARATNNGALPSPATQCTPIRPSLPALICLGFRWVTATSYLLSSTISTFSILFVSISLVCLIGSLVSKKSVTIPNHLLITAWLGNWPSGNISSYMCISFNVRLPSHQCRFCAVLPHHRSSHNTLVKFWHCAV
jgi:hypothetical protein